MRAPRVSPPVAAEAPQGPTLPLSTLTVGYGGAALLKRMLDSLLASKPPPAEGILVDNASPEPLGEVFGAFAAAAREAGIRPVLVEAGANLGFGGGNTAGLKHATQPWVMLVNPDTEVEPATLAALLEATKALPGPCVSQPLLLFSERRDTINSAGIAPYLDGGFVDMLCEAPRERLRAREPIEIAAATGACALFPREFPGTYGFFDPDYFLYFEDVDLGLRWRRMGVRAFLVPSATMFHHWHGTTGKAEGALAVEISSNQIKTVAKNYPPLEAIVAGLLWSAVTASYLWWRGRPVEGRTRVNAAARELRQWRLLLSKRREVRALGPDARVRRWIVLPKLPRFADPPQLR